MKHALQGVAEVGGGGGHAAVHLHGAAADDDAGGVLGGQRSAGHESVWGRTLGLLRLKPRGCPRQQLSTLRCLIYASHAAAGADVGVTGTRGPPGGSAALKLQQQVEVKLVFFMLGGDTHILPIKGLRVQELDLLDVFHLEVALSDRLNNRSQRGCCNLLSSPLQQPTPRVHQLKYSLQALQMLRQALGRGLLLGAAHRRCSGGLAISATLLGGRRSVWRARGYAGRGRGHRRWLWQGASCSQQHGCSSRALVHA
mmetsp:Transcript_19873/g.55415  ORF Transcript_19873/g.55415 Transcript_19873/m.55415 type:complete len:255 (+) Transcript_19873:125-889(+)